MEIAIVIFESLLMVAGIVLGVVTILSIAAWFYSSMEQIKKSLRNIEQEINRVKKGEEKDEREAIYSQM